MTGGSETLEAADLIDALLLRLEKLAQSRPAFPAFHRQAADDLTASLGIARYRLSRVAAGDPVPLFTTGDATTAPDDLRRAAEAETALIDRVREGTRYLVATLRAPESVEVLELLYPGQLEPVLQRRMGQVVEAVAEIVADYARGEQSSIAGGLAAHWPRIDQTLKSLYAAPADPQGATAIAVALQSLWQSDRVSLLVRRSSGFRIQGSSVPTAREKRTRTVRHLEALCEQVVRTRQPLIFDHGTTTIDLRSAGKKALQDYVSESLVRRLRIYPIAARPDARHATIALVAENFSTEANESTESLEALVVPHAEQAVQTWWDRAGGGWWGRLTGSRLFSRTARYLAIAALVAAGLWMALQSQTPFYVQADGRLMPRERTAVFAPADGFIAELAVRHGEAVAANGALLRVQDPELDRLRQKVVGDLATWESRVSSIKTLRTQGLIRGNQPSSDLAALSVEEEQLQVQIRGARRQLELMDAEVAKLSLTARQAGEVDGWNIEQTLPHRPVRRGQHLFDILGTDGPWHVELEIPDDVAGYVRDAGLETSVRPVRFLLRSQPLHEYAGKLVRLNETTELNSSGQLVLRGFTEYPADQIEQPQAGATVTAKIHCGERSIAFVWSRRLLEYLYRTFVL